MAWTEDQIDQLKELWGEGLSTSEIGRKLGVTKNAVVVRLTALACHHGPARSSALSAPSVRRGPRSWL